jgi:hypothetical protein
VSFTRRIGNVFVHGNVLGEDEGSDQVIVAKMRGWGRNYPLVGL